MQIFCLLLALCTQLVSHLPSCSTSEFLRPLAKAGLAVGSVACGLLLTIPEALAKFCLDKDKAFGKNETKSTVPICSLAFDSPWSTS